MRTHTNRGAQDHMGIKSLSLQMIPWCFHIMGSGADAGDRPDPPASRAAAGCCRGAPALCVRLIRVDGRVEVYHYHRQVSAGELVKEHPMHLVCRSDAFTIGQRIPALADGDQLQSGRSYFLLPLHFFQSVLSFVTLASSFARAAAASSSNGSACSSPLLQRLLEVHKTPSGKLQIRVSEDFIRRIQEGVRDSTGGGVVVVRGGPGQLGSTGGGSSRVCTTAALEKDYRQLVVGCRERQWKPKLETITESAERKRGKLSAVVGGAAGGAVLDGGIRWRRSYKKSYYYSHEVEPRGGDQRQQKQEKKQQEQKAPDPPPKRKNKGGDGSKGSAHAACHGRGRERY